MYIHIYIYIYNVYIYIYIYTGRTTDAGARVAEAFLGGWEAGRSASQPTRQTRQPHLMFRIPLPPDPPPYLVPLRLTRIEVWLDNPLPWTLLGCHGCPVLGYSSLPASLGEVLTTVVTPFWNGLADRSHRPLHKNSAKHASKLLYF